MKLRSKNKEEAHEELAQKIANSILDAQRRLANILNQQTSKCSAKSLMLGIISGCILFGTYCLYLLLTAFN